MLIYQYKDGYCYNSDTIFLYDFALGFKPKGLLLDIGSGTGILGLLIARDTKIKLHSLEIQEEYIFLSQKNAKINDIESKVIHNNLLFLDENCKYDFIVSNPPFYHSDVIQSKNKRLNIARYNHNLPLIDFFKKVNRLLKPRGYFIFCYDAKQIQYIMVLLYQNKMIVETIQYVYPDSKKDASLVMIQIRKGSKSSVKTLKPLFVFEQEKFSLEAQKIYKQARTHSIKC